MECPICGFDKWHDLDYLRNQKYWYYRDLRKKNNPVGFKICEECGFVTYNYVDEEILKETYDSYRKIMKAENIVTCNRKNEYHKNFLGEIITSLSGNVLDVGCAQGSFLNLIQNMNKNVNCFGTEWSDGFSAYGKSEYGLNITKKINESIKYNFVSYYHVLEHIQNPQNELNKIYNLLTDDGLLYIGIPYFFEELEEQCGDITADFENLYHLNHVNVFSKKSFFNLLNKCGFNIIKENDKTYGLMVLCNKKDKVQVFIQKEDWREIVEKLEKQKIAMQKFIENKYDEAISIYPKYPDAYIYKSRTEKIIKDFNLRKNILEDGLNNCKNNLRLVGELALLYYQWDQNTPENYNFYSNNIRQSEEYYKNLILERPHEFLYRQLTLINYTYKKDYEKAKYFLKKVLEINPIEFARVHNELAVIYNKENGIGEHNDL